MSDAERPRAEQPGADRPDLRQREITDARTMRALAHPIRLALLDVIRREGELTATRAADLLGESPGNMSWHLQTLAKYGFVEEAGDGKGRARPWRIAKGSERFRAHTDDPDAGAAGAVLVAQVLDRVLEQAREWLAARAALPPVWRNSAFLNTSVAYMTPEELMAAGEEIEAIFTRYDDRSDRGKRPEGAQPVHLTGFAHPLPPTESGN